MKELEGRRKKKCKLYDAHHIVKTEKGASFSPKFPLSS